jgi:glycine dehydrogenase subunit 2
MTKTIYEKSQSQQKAYSLPAEDPAFQQFQPSEQVLRKASLQMPEITELDLTRHFHGLAKRNMSIDGNFYPLGSCTMKFNPRINEWCADLDGFTKTHPFAPDESVQGNLQVIFELIEFLCALCGMSGGTLLPNAGAQGEFVGISMIKAYHASRQDDKRNEILIPDNAHGTNPATATMAGYRTLSLRTNTQGHVDLEQLRSLLSDKTAGLMLTNPNTLGLFSPIIIEVASMVHEAGGLLYYDGANLNPMLNVVRPGDMGFDVMHINLHKTFSTPHGGGGPGAGPVLCNDKLKEFLPFPRVEKKDEGYVLSWENGRALGKIASFHGNFAIYLRAYLYVKLHGFFGLRKIAEQSVLNANYLKKYLGELFTIPFPQACMHEFVAQADNFLDRGVKALDIAKRLLDYGFHPPTIYFPLIIKECMLIEPTESESKETLDQFIAAMRQIVEEIKKNPDLVKSAPHTLPVSRLDEVLAAKKPILNISSALEG